MSTDHARLVEEIGTVLAELQAAYDDRDRAMAEALGVNRTDLRCLDLIVRHGPQTASDLGARLRLTRGSMTTLIDRLERVGYVRRHTDPNHGRRKLITATPQLAAAVTPLVTDARDSGHRRLAPYTPTQLRLIRDFLTETCQAQRTTTTKIRQTQPAPNPNSKDLA